MSRLPRKVDSHHHLWSLTDNEYAWLTSDLKPLYRNFSTTDLLKANQGCGITKTVLVQASATDKETDDLLSLARSHEFIVGVVGWVDLSGNIKNTCQRLTYLANQPFFKGIRPMLQDMPNKDWIADSKFAPIFNKLIELDLTFDALVNEDHLEAIFTIAMRNPKLKIVIDHCAKPQIRNNKISIWSERIKRFANLDNVYIKLSGLTTEASANQQSSSHFQAYVDLVYQVFGPKRIMWGSDWPVVNMNSNYQDWLQLTQQLCLDWTEAEQTQLFETTATTFYQLNKH